MKPTADSLLVDAILAGLLAIAACVVFRGALAYFFAQDDFTWLARAGGLISPAPFPWRWLSGQAFFGVMRALAGLSPFPYHAVSLGVHALATVIVYRVCRRFADPAPAAVGAAFFAAHPASFTALYWVSALSTSLAALFAWASLLVATRPGRSSWLALPLFGLSLLSKESTVFLSLLALLPGLRLDRGRPVVAWAMIALSLVYLVLFATRDVFGALGASPESAAYALRFDRSLWEAHLTYDGWTVTFLSPFVHSFVDAIDPSVFAAGIVAGLVWLAGLAWSRLRRRGWLLGGVAYTLALLPVLPLAHHVYHYYLYAALPAAAILVAALAASVYELLLRTLNTRWTRAALGLVALAFVVNGVVLVDRIEHYPFIDPELRSEPTVDRARIAANALADLRSAGVPSGTELRFWSPASIDRERARGRDTSRESYWESNVRAALDDGLGARVMIPEVKSVTFVRDFEPATDPVRYAVYLPNGHLRVATPAELESALRGGTP